MKKKIIIICIAVTVVAGAGGIGFTVSNSKNDKELESAVNEAVSLALSTSEESTQAASIEVATEESTSAETTNANTEKTTENQTTTTEPQTVLIKDNKGAEIVKNKDSNSEEADAAKVEHFDNHNYIDIETPIGTITIDKNEYREDKIGRFWTTNDIRYHSPITKRDEILCVDEEYKLFYFDRNRDRVYPEF